jgi:beta-N-acetylhexosaminidase
MKNIVLLIILLSFSSQLKAQEGHDFVTFINQQHDWVDSVYKKLNKRERIAQLFMVRAHTNLGQRYIDSVAKVIKNEKLGGVVLFQGGPVRHANLINRYQALAKVPLLIAIDGEWGLGMRLPDSAISYPYQMALGAIQNNTLIYTMGQEVAKDLKRLGVNINFAPVVDINNNPRNPVINYRSFGENRENVTQKGAAYMKGMMSERIIVSLKHFPGHGDTDADSHYDLPKLDFSKSRLDSLEISPFKSLIEAGASGVMVAHLNIPSLDNTPNLPSSLSKRVVTDLLKDELKFDGLVFTDAMDMEGVVKYFRDGEADVRAIIAGSDVLELSQNSKRANRMIRKAIRMKRIDKLELETRVKKVLAAKYWLGLNNFKSIQTQSLYKDLNRDSSKRFHQLLADNAITLLKGKEVLSQNSFSKRTAIISIGTEKISTFQEILSNSFDNELNFILSSKATADEIVKVNSALRNYDQVIIALHDENSRPGSILNYNENIKLFISELASRNSQFIVFANPYTLASFPGIEASPVIVVGYQNDKTMQTAGAKVFLKQIETKGKLPITVNSFFKYGDGL